MSQRTIGRRSVLAGLCTAIMPAAAADDKFARDRGAMAQTVKRRLAKAGLAGHALFRPVIRAIELVPRHLFVPDTEIGSAYEDRPLPIGEGQTISDPTIVAMMTILLGVERDARVLEVGTGSGYQAAILSYLAREVFTVEIVHELARKARHRLALLGYTNVHAITGDGYLGWPGAAPFDAIIVTAGATHIPQPLIDQLKPGGRLVIPLGPNWAQEELTLVRKSSQGRLTFKRYGQVFFVDFTGQMKAEDHRQFQKTDE